MDKIDFATFEAKIQSVTIARKKYMEIFFFFQQMKDASKEYRKTNLSLELKSLQISFPEEDELPPPHPECTRVAYLIQRGPAGFKKRETVWQVEKIEFF